MNRFEDRIDKVVEMINKLPPMPDNISKLRRLCADPNVRFKDFTPLIEQDPGLCADILHMANSAYFGINHSVDNISEAVRYLGMGNLVDYISISFSNKVIRESFSGIKDLNEYFTHSRLISMSTRILATVAGKSRVEQEFYSVCGLLHDIGRLILLVVGGEDMSDYVGLDWMYIEDQIEKEENLLGLDHTLVGEKICAKWEFSKMLQQAVRQHHVPLDSQFFEQAAFIFLAHFVSMDDFPIDLVYAILPEENVLSMGLSFNKMKEARELIETNLNELDLSI